MTNVEIENDHYHYVGGIENGFFQGYGVLEYKDGTIYKGNFDFGIKTGAGEIFFPDGSKYIGEFKNGLFHGLGYYEFAKTETSEIYKFCHKSQKSVKTSDWKEYNKGRFHYQQFISGKSFRKLGGDTYEGDVSGNLKHGHGINCYPDGGFYIGEFFEDQRHGKAMLVYGSSRENIMYIGNYVHNYKQGFGRFWYRNGSSYEGNFNKHDRHGENCTFRFANGEIYKGPFVSNQAEGEGELTQPGTDNYKRGLFKNFKFVQGEMFESTKDYTYLGESMDSKFHGYGKLITNSKSKIYEGTFENGLKSGYGEEIKLDEENEIIFTYFGHYFQNKRSGTTCAKFKFFPEGACNLS